MNLEKKLAKYARHLDNPKYYDKITKILMKADKTGYQFKSFNDFDMMKISGELAAYYDAITTDEEHKRMVRYYNKHWFIISDKNYIIWESQSFLIALSTYIRAYLILWCARFKQMFVNDRLITTDNMNNEIYFVQGAINVAKLLNCKVWDIEDKWVEN